MRKILFYLLLCIAFLSKAQIQWETNYVAAQAKAIAEQKLIMRDFTAVWCGPCKAMDKSLWISNELDDLNDFVVPVKVDIDFAENRYVAQNFNVNSIPRVILMTPWDEVIWEQLGFRSPNSYLRILNEIPINLKKLYSSYKPNASNASELLEIAKAYQAIAMRTINNQLKNGFLMLADNYLRDAGSAAENRDTEIRIELYEYLNMAYRGQVAKAMKKLGKLDEEGEGIEELKAFIMAYCYKCEGENKKFNEEFAKIEEEECKEQLTNN